MWIRGKVQSSQLPMCNILTLHRLTTEDLEGLSIPNPGGNPSLSSKYKSNKIKDLGQGWLI